MKLVFYFTLIFSFFAMENQAFASFDEPEYCALQTKAIGAFTDSFTNLSTDSERLELLRQATTTKDRARFILCFLDQIRANSLKENFLYFLNEAVRANEISKNQHLNILSQLLNTQLVLRSVRALAFDQLTSYMFLESIDVAYFDDILTNTKTPIDLRAELVQKYLKKGVCSDPVVEGITQTIVHQNLDMSLRDVLLEKSFRACEESPKFKEAVSLLAVTPNLEWSLRKKVLTYEKDHNETCSTEIASYLLELFSKNGNWHVRDGALWLLAEMSNGECDQQVISFFSQMIHQDASKISAQDLNFRQEKIKTILWALVRIGVKNQNKLVAKELKAVAMDYNRNMYFRITAVEALQDMSLYSLTAAQALYEIVRDNKRISTSDFANYYQQIRDANDAEVRHYALTSLAALLQEDVLDFLPFAGRYLGRVDSDQIHRIKALQGQIIPNDLSSYARPVLQQLAEDSAVDQDSRNFARKVLLLKEEGGMH